MIPFAFVRFVYINFVQLHTLVTQSQFFTKIVLIPKLHILLYLPVFSTIKTVFCSQKLLSQINLFYSYYASSWNMKRRACLNVLYSVFLSRLGELWHNTGENKFTDFRQANEPVKYNFIQIFPQKSSRKKHKKKF